MFFRLMVFLLCSLIFFTEIRSEIIEIQQIEDILPVVQEDSLVLFNIAEVLTDSEISLGSSPWRRYVRNLVNNDLHDTLTWLIFNKIPHQVVETKTPEVIQNLQNKGIATAAFTSRGRSEWYSTYQEGVDDKTEELLEKMGIDFKKSQLPFYFIQQEDSYFLTHFHNGIIYSEHMEKGDFLKELLLDSGYLPNSVILVDDKYDSLVSVENALSEFGINFHGFWYTKTSQKRKNFSPMVANIQLQALVMEGAILTDEEAQGIADSQYADMDPDVFFLNLIDQSINF